MITIIIMIIIKEKVIIKVKVVAMNEPKKLSNVKYAFYCDVIYGANGEKW